MREIVLRWEGRLGSLKGLAIIVGLLALVFLTPALSGLSLSLSNLKGPHEVTISQLVAGEVGTERYVSVSGVALYDSGYQATVGSEVIRRYYFLLDPDADDMILVEPRSPLSATGEAEAFTTITGTTHYTPRDLEFVIVGDLDGYHEYGLETTETLYVREGETPLFASLGLLDICVTGPILLLCLASFSCRSVVFAPHPVNAAMRPPLGSISVGATGRFLSRKQLTPGIELGEESRRFTNTIAGTILKDGRLTVHVHHIARTRGRGLTATIAESDWATFVEAQAAHAVEPGKVYGWRDRWAVRFQYQAPDNRLETLLLVFEQRSAQADFVRRLQEEGFTVAGGGAAGSCR